MLPDPPCVEGLIGCPGPRNGSISRTLDSTFLGRSGASSSSRSSTILGATGFQSGASNTSSTERNVAYSSYTLTARNTGRSSLSSIVLKHGSLPSGVSFDAGRSASQCKQGADAVECTVDLGPSQSKYLTLVYTSDDGVECAKAPTLNSASATSGSGSAHVRANVSCVTRHEKRTIQSRVASGTGSRAGGGVIVQAPTVGVGTLGISPTSTQDFKPTQLSPIVGYKPVPVYPQTGIEAALLSHTVPDVLMPVVIHSDVISSAQIFLAAGLSLFIFFSGRVVSKYR